MGFLRRRESYYVIYHRPRRGRLLGPVLFGLMFTTGLLLGWCLLLSLFLAAMLGALGYAARRPRW